MSVHERSKELVSQDETTGKAPCKEKVCFLDVTQYLLKLQEPLITPFPLLSDVKAGFHFFVDEDFLMEDSFSVLFILLQLLGINNA